MDNKQEIKRELGIVISKKIDRMIVSNRVGNYDYKKIEIRPITIKGREQYQFSSYTENKVFQSNIDSIMLLEKLLEIFPDKMRQINIFADGCEVSYKVTKKGKLLSNVNKNVSSSISDNTHNRTKNYILKEGTIIPPLVDMGVFTKDGHVVKSMYDKFKQINRFVELVDDVLKDYRGEEINIIDFGCGKSYLTFIMYYYLVELKGKKANIIGLDLKSDVIEKCNKAAVKYGYEGLHFEMGNIDGYKTKMNIDMVVSLHACDTATDFAISNAVKWNAKYILAVPCCQHEVNRQIKSDVLAPLMKYGIIKERTSALVTDALRGNMLEYHGYKTQVMEFVDMAHSPKTYLSEQSKEA